MFVTYFLLLSGVGLAVVTQAQECSKPVGGANMNLKGDDILLQNFPDGKQVTFACNVGYTTIGGSSSITCKAGAWTVLTLKCDRKDCGSAGEVENGNVDYPEGTQFGDRLEVTCNTGYNMVPFDKARILCGDGKWMDRLPECEVVTCDLPPVVANGVFSPVKDFYIYREVVQYKCLNGYTLSGSTSISCSEHGTFGPAPACVMVQCNEPKIDNARQVEGSRPPHGYRATVTYECMSGYVMEGGRSLTCGIDSRWFPALPTCRRIPDSTKPPTTPTTTTTTHSPPATPDNHGTNVAIGMSVFLVVLSVVVGVALYVKKRQRSRRDCPDKKKEDVELPLQGQTAKHS
ncbi:membrane cofactor protein-like [Etheostoma cragini]|uniref:membrane cofactor protein-like n=1 Tax=Etheostoma cragini TaxID=417921 RepID=UPI00155EEA97|nr:membrane cofactor protein-like [Etheostoma cragini]